MCQAYLMQGKEKCSIVHHKNFVTYNKVQPVQPAEPRHRVPEDLADLPDRRRHAPHWLGDSLLERRPGGEK